MPFCSDNDIRCFSAPQTPKEKLQSTSQTGGRCVVAFGTLRALPCSCTISPIALSSEDGTRCRGHCELNWPLGALNRDPSCGRLAQLHCPAMRHAVAAAGRVPWSASPYRPFFKHVTVTERVAGRSVAAAAVCGEKNSVTVGSAKNEQCVLALQGTRPAAATAHRMAGQWS